MAALGIVLAYNLYWLLVIMLFVWVESGEVRMRVPGWELKAGKRHREEKVLAADALTSDEKAEHRDGPAVAELLH